MYRQTLKRWLLGLAVVTVSTLATTSVALAGADHVRWDIISINPPADLMADPGGIASASAIDGSKIVLTGEGTFVAPAGGNGTSSAVTGGGTWETFTAANVSTGSGTYWVTGLVRWEVAPGILPSPPVTDNIDSASNASSGLAVLRITYSDGSRGVLVVSCHLPVGAPDPSFEGITASKGFVDYFNSQAPIPGVDANRTLFHVRP
jgi:hypothetical protein